MHAQPQMSMHCRFCGRPLTPLQALQHKSCERAACRRRHELDAQAAAQAAELQARRRVAAKATGDTRALQAAAVQLQPHRARLVPSRVAQRRAQIEYLRALATQGASMQASDASHATEAATASHPQPPAPGPTASQVCAFCGGRCCRHGAFTHAFIDRALLQRWVDAHPGATLHDAAAAYAARLPDRHVEGSCLHHGRSGCTLAREMRSDICNQHACDGLIEAQRQMAAGVPEGLVVSMAAGGRVQRAVWLSEGGAQPLTQRPRRNVKA
jgi:hypothetical protein